MHDCPRPADALPDPPSHPGWHASLRLGFVRDGAATRLAERRHAGPLRVQKALLLGRLDVMEGVPEMIPEIQVEATFPDGTKLVTVHHPIP